MKNAILIIIAGIVVSCATSKDVYTSIEEENETMVPKASIESIDYSANELIENQQYDEPTFETVFGSISEPEVIAIEDVKEFDPID